jgi:hypothetical protein
MRYHLLVAYLLDRRGAGVHEMLSRDYDRTRLEKEIQEGGPETTDRGLGEQPSER